MHNPLVSVLIPCYNHEKYVQECIKSIIDQDYQNIELIIIDDGSKDNSFEKIIEIKDECERRFVNFSYSKQENSGTCITFNKLFESSKGEYIYFIASDDVAMPDAVSTELKHFDDETVIVVGDNYIIDSDSNIVGWDKNRKCVPVEKSEYKTFMSAIKNNSEVLKQDFKKFGSYETLIKGNHIPNGQLIKRSAFSKTGGYDTKAPLEDWYMNLQLAKIGIIKYVDEPLFKYRWHNSNTVKNNEKMLKISLETYLYEKELLLAAKDTERLEIWKRNDITFVNSFYGYFDLVARDGKSDLRNMLNLCFENILSPTRKQKIFHLIANISLLRLGFRVYSKIRNF